MKSFGRKERIPPRKGYLLFDDQPARTIPYTPREETAKMKSMPTSRSARIKGELSPASLKNSPKGRTVMVVRAGTRATKGAR